MLKKYKLIKEFPNSPPIGTEVQKLTETAQKYYTISKSFSMWFILKDVENFPEFWEKIIEKTWEILSIKEPYNEYLLTHTGNGKWGNGVNVSNCSLEWLLEHSCTIHSVKRLSDGEIFSIGDYVKLHSGWIDENCFIDSFKLSNNKLDFQIIQEEKYCWYGESYGHNINMWSKVTKFPIFQTSDGVLIYDEDIYWYVNDDYCIHGATCGGFNENWNKYKTFSTKKLAEEYVKKYKVLFVTEDGVEIFEGNVIWFISRNLSKEDWKFPLATTVSKDTLFREHHMYFASEKAAKQYIEDNKPIYSKKQVIKMLNSFDYDNFGYEESCANYENYLI